MAVTQNEISEIGLVVGNNLLVVLGMLMAVVVTEYPL